jgi:hypothetical protein
MKYEESTQYTFLCIKELGRRSYNLHKQLGGDGQTVQVVLALCRSHLFEAITSARDNAVTRHFRALQIPINSAPVRHAAGGYIRAAVGCYPELN